MKIKFLKVLLMFVFLRIVLRSGVFLIISDNSQSLSKDE